MPEDIVSYYKDKEILELQEQLKRAHLVIARLQHDNRELKKIVLEKTSKIGEIEPVVKTITFVTKSKGKEKVVIESIQELEASSTRFCMIWF